MAYAQSAVIVPSIRVPSIELTQPLVLGQADLAGPRIRTLPAVAAFSAVKERLFSVAAQPPSFFDSHRFSSCDVLIHPEHVRRVVLSFDANEPLILLPECRTHERLHVVVDTWEIEVRFAA